MCSSIEKWLDALRDGDDEATRFLWNEFFERLCERISPQTQILRVADCEDIALIALVEFIDGLKRGQFLDIETSDEIWCLLVTIANRRVKDSQRYEGRACRGGSVKTFSFDEMRAELITNSTYVSSCDLPAALRDLLQSIDDERLVKLLDWKMDGCSVGEIASRLGCGVRNVQYLECQLLKKVRTFNQVADFWEANESWRVPLKLECKP